MYAVLNITFAAAAILDFVGSQTDGKSVSGMWFWVSVQNFVQICAKMAELSPLKQNVKMAAAAILYFVGCKFWR